MKRRTIRILFVIALCALAIALTVACATWFQIEWSGGMGGLIGASIALWGGKLFDWIWPAPKPGWKE